jgi:hypothetical protein
MSTTRKTKGNGKAPVQPAGRRRLPRWPLAVLAVGVLAAGGFWWSKGRHADAPNTAASAVMAATTNEPASIGGRDDSFAKLKGRWLRPDGGYVLEISRVDPSGNLEAAYLNPRPIHVAQAHALRDGTATKVLVELRDVNYPGSTYNLVYEPTSDVLKGIYFQAALKQEFEVFFERMR